MKKLLPCKMTKVISKILLGCLLLLPASFPPEVPGGEIVNTWTAPEEEDDETAAPCADLDKGPGCKPEGNKES